MDMIRARRMLSLLILFIMISSVRNGVSTPFMIIQLIAAIVLLGLSIVDVIRYMKLGGK